eukprot:TRINITY_DN11057_c0_g4_i1.p1 TRINITY_DN11057_c0_g4~~TRINITY_DN11057_c0_g4_i1.p1  ORF type:complete len:312 (+),score=99.08 TRINITY_DN11057_c0_g4_i1:72-1007(+)
MGNACRSEDREDVYVNNYDAGLYGVGPQRPNTRFGRFQAKRETRAQEKRGGGPAAPPPPPAPARDARREPLASDEAVREVTEARRVEMEEYRLKEERSTRHLYDLLNQQRKDSTAASNAAENEAAPVTPPPTAPEDEGHPEMAREAGLSPGLFSDTCADDAGTPALQPRAVRDDDELSNDCLETSSSISLAEVGVLENDVTPYKSAAGDSATPQTARTADTTQATPAVHIDVPEEEHKGCGMKECFICLEDYDPAQSAFLPCLHSFHSSCVKDWLLTQHKNGRPLSCPVCFTELDMSALRHVQTIEAQAAT